MPNGWTAWENWLPTDLLLCQSSRPINVVRGVSAYERVQTIKKNPNSIFKSVRVRLQESVCLQERINTEFDWEVKTEIDHIYGICVI